MAEFHLETETHGPCLIMRPRGYLDAAAGEKVKAACVDALGKGIRKVVLNLTGSPVINSTGVAQILEMTEILVDDHAGILGLCGLSELTMSVLKMVGLLTPEIHFASEEEAVTRLTTV
jgi:anti-anti-sigma factor